ncbi:protein kinase putative (LDK) [Leptomonas seymouri]|uniref:Protein kinase putative (LDK) n=1 Tax=Leptomonas seymouri TaxID=5684 RepID=A0A0N1PD19_LEPSE|nr:protein kinase putative (LDK) [Leptomonas seymouri]|eukprot:KPI87883.1 protein kinase putative (LDK) [Leptomonas seymouri]
MASGKVIGDKARYRLDSPLAVGAFSTVYQCTELSSGRSYAMKIIDKKVAADHHMKEALIREVNALEVVSGSPYITKLVDKMLSKNNYYIVMELAEGGTLLDLIREQRQELRMLQASISSYRDVSESLRSLVPPVMQYDRVQHFFKQLLLALSSLHDHNVVHRDVKPENILLNKRRTRLVLSDFGFACHTRPGSMLHRACGTLRYCAPELLHENPLYDGRKVDVWAAGVTLYVMLFGGHPFRCTNQDPDSLLEVITTTRFCIPRPIPAEIEDILHRMLCVDPVERWSVRQLLQHPWMVALGADLRLSSMSSSPTLTRNFSSFAAASISSALSRLPARDTAEAVVEILSEEYPPIDAIPSDEEVVDDGFYYSSTYDSQSSSVGSRPVQSGSAARAVKRRAHDNIPLGAADLHFPLFTSLTASSMPLAPTRCEMLQEGSMSTSMVSIHSSVTDNSDVCEAEDYFSDGGGAPCTNGMASGAAALHTKGGRRSASDMDSSMSTSNLFRESNQLGFWWTRYAYGLYLTARIVARFAGFFALCVVAVAVRVIMKRDLADLPLPAVVRNYVTFLLFTPLRHSTVAHYEQQQCIPQQQQQQQGTPQEQLSPPSQSMAGTSFLSFISFSAIPIHTRKRNVVTKTGSHSSKCVSMSTIPGSSLRHYVRTADQLMRGSFVGSAVLEGNASFSNSQRSLSLLSEVPSKEFGRPIHGVLNLATTAPAQLSVVQSPVMTEGWLSATQSMTTHCGGADGFTASGKRSTEHSGRNARCNTLTQQTEEGVARAYGKNAMPKNDSAAMRRRTSTMPSLVTTMSASQLETVPSKAVRGRTPTSVVGDGRHGESQTGSIETPESGDSGGENSAVFSDQHYIFSPITPLPRAFPGHRPRSEDFSVVNSEAAAR